MAAFFGRKGIISASILLRKAWLGSKSIHVKTIGTYLGDLHVLTMNNVDPDPRCTCIYHLNKDPHGSLTAAS